MSYHIAIPSHRRWEIFKEKTLAYLQRTNVDMARVTVFLSDSEDMQAYNDCPISVKCVETGAKNVTEKFNAIHDFYEKGEEVFVMEDDISLILGLGGNEKMELHDLHQLITKGFERIPLGGLWGLAPHDNSFFFSMKEKEGLMLVVAHAFGFVSTQNPELAVTQIAKSDYERTLRYFVKYGSVHRLDWVGAKTKSYTQKGGMQSDHSREERYAHERDAVDYMCKMWPHFVSENVKKKSIFPELNLSRKAFTPTDIRRLMGDR